MSGTTIGLNSFTNVDVNTASNFTFEYTDVFGNGLNGLPIYTTTTLLTFTAPTLSLYCPSINSTTQEYVFTAAGDNATRRRVLLGTATALATTVKTPLDDATKG